MKVNRPHICRLRASAPFRGHSIFHVLCQGRARKHKTNRKGNRSATVPAATSLSSGEPIPRKTSSVGTTSARNNLLHKVRLVILLSACSHGRALKLRQTSLQLLMKFVLGHNPEHTCQQAAVI